MIDEIIIWVLVFGVGIWVFLCLAGSCARNYCRCISEPRGDDDEKLNEIETKGGEK